MIQSLLYSKCLRMSSNDYSFSEWEATTLKNMKLNRKTDLLLKKTQLLVRD